MTEPGKPRAHPSAVPRDLTATEARLRGRTIWQDAELDQLGPECMDALLATVDWSFVAEQFGVGAAAAAEASSSATDVQQGGTSGPAEQQTDASAAAESAEPSATALRDAATRALAAARSRRAASERSSGHHGDERLARKWRRLTAGITKVARELANARARVAAAEAAEQAARGDAGEQQIGQSATAELGGASSTAETPRDTSADVERQRAKDALDA